MKRYNLYLTPSYTDSKENKILIARSRTGKGINRKILKIKEKFGFGSIPYCRYWRFLDYTVIDFGCWSYYLLMQEEVI